VREHSEKFRIHCSSAFRAHNKVSTLPFCYWTRKAIRSYIGSKEGLKTFDPVSGYVRVDGHRKRKCVVVQEQLNVVCCSDVHLSQYAQQVNTRIAKTMVFCNHNQMTWREVEYRKFRGAEKLLLNSYWDHEKRDLRLEKVFFLNVL